MRQILGNETSSNMDSSGEDSENNQVKKSFGCKQAFQITNIGADEQKYKNTGRKTYQHTNMQTFKLLIMWTYRHTNTIKISPPNQDSLEFVDTSLQYNVYELDMQSAINTALYMEVKATVCCYETVLVCFLFPLM